MAGQPQPGSLSTRPGWWSRQDPGVPEMLSSGFSSRSACDRHHGHGPVLCDPPNPYYGIDHGIPLLQALTSLHSGRDCLGFSSNVRQSHVKGSYLKDKTPSLCLSEKHNTSDTIRSVGKRRRGSSSSHVVHGNLADSSFHSLGLHLPGVAEPSCSSELPTTPSPPLLLNGGI